MEIDWQAILDKAIGFVQLHGPGLGWAIATFVIGRWVAKIVRRILKGIMRRAKMDPTLVGFLTNLVYALLMTFVIISSVAKLGVQTGSLIAILGAAGLAVAFALQGSLSNFAAGVMIILFRPFKQGDFVEAGGATGTIVEIQIFSTIVKTGDNKKVIVPNSSMMGGNITNYSAFDTRRVDLVAGIGYEDDIPKAKETLKRILEDHPLVLDDPAPAVALIALADSSVNFNVRPWCKTADYWTVYSEVTEAIKVEFDKQGISIPFPQRDVHVYKAGDAA